MKRYFYFYMPAIIFMNSCVSQITHQPGKNDLPVEPSAAAEVLPLSEQQSQFIKSLGGEILTDNNIKIGEIIIHRREKELSFPGLINMTNGPIEVLVCTPVGRMHESLLRSKADPFHLQFALILLGAENGARKPGSKISQGTLMDIEISADLGKTRIPVEKFILNKKTGKEMQENGWVFVGSSFTFDGKSMATEEGNLVNIWSCGNTVLDNPSDDGDNDDSYEIISGKTPPFETPVTIYIKFRPDKQD